MYLDNLNQDSTQHYKTHPTVAFADSAASEGPTRGIVAGKDRMQRRSPMKATPNPPPALRWSRDLPSSACDLPPVDDCVILSLGSDPESHRRWFGEHRSRAAEIPSAGHTHVPPHAAVTEEDASERHSQAGSWRCNRRGGTDTALPRHATPP